MSSHLGVRSAGEASVVAVVTGSVLQAEAGLVALGHRVVGAGVQQLVVAKLVHAVEVPAAMIDIFSRWSGGQSDRRTVRAEINQATGSSEVLDTH